MIWRKKNPAPPPPPPVQDQERILLFPADILADFLLVDAGNEITNLGSIERLDLAISEGQPDSFRIVHREFGEKLFSWRPPERYVANPLVECWAEIIDPDSPPNASWLLLRAICATVIWRQSGRAERVKIALDADMPEAQQVVLAAMFAETDGARVADYNTGAEIPISFSEIL